jgi:V/A-type H+/Na+-transporting ATPase subunit D
MPETGEVAATRVAMLELRDERRLVQEGYELLDEKRVLLATEILRQLRQHMALDHTQQEQWQAARTALGAAIEVHGFDDLTVEPPVSLADARMLIERRTFLGLPLRMATLEAGSALPVAPPVRSTPELRRTAAAFGTLAASLVTQAALEANLRCLVAEYRRTERRARALENVLLPEIDRSLRSIEEQLDAVDQEEAVRVRNAAQCGPPGSAPNRT